MRLDAPTREWLNKFGERWIRRTDPFHNYSKIFGAIPDVPAQALHSTRLFANRYEAISSLPKGGVVAEIGTLTGNFAKFLLENVEPVALHLFDLHFNQLKRLNPNLQHDPRVKLHLGDSSTRMSELPDKSFDIIYVDGDHTECGVRRDADVASKKLKAGGFLVFNDYTIWSPLEMCDYGVVPVVNEMLNSGEWVVSYFAFHPVMYCDIAIHRSPRSG